MGRGALLVAGLDDLSPWGRSGLDGLPPWGRSGLDGFGPGFRISNLLLRSLTSLIEKGTSLTASRERSAKGMAPDLRFLNTFFILLKKFLIT